MPMRNAGANGFGWRLRHVRDRARLTQERLADQADLSRQWVAKIESGRAEPRISDALALFDVLAEESPGLRLEWLLAGRGPEHGTVDDSVERRHFSKLLGTLLLPAALPVTLDLERLGSNARTDSGLIDSWESLTAHYAELRPVERPDELLPMIEAHLLRLRSRVVEQAVGGGLWRRLLSVTAGTAALAGWVCFIAERRHDAGNRLALAEELAREADDRDTLVLILMLRADLVSAVPTGGQEGLPELAQRHLDEAVALASSVTPFALLAPVLLRRAEEHAYAGQETESLRRLDDSARIVAGSDTRHHYLRPQWASGPDVDRVLLAIRGNCLQMLGRTQEAIDLLSAGETRFPGDRMAMLTDLASAHAQQGDLDRACELLSSAADLVTEHGFPVAARRIMGVRRLHLDRWRREPAVSALDERLAQIL